MNVENVYGVFGEAWNWGQGIDSEKSSIKGFYQLNWFSSV